MEVSWLIRHQTFARLKLSYRSTVGAHGTHPIMSDPIKLVISYDMKPGEEEACHRYIVQEIGARSMNLAFVLPTPGYTAWGSGPNSWVVDCSIALRPAIVAQPGMGRCRCWPSALRESLFCEVGATGRDVPDLDRVGAGRSEGGCVGVPYDIEKIGVSGYSSGVVFQSPVIFSLF